MLYLTARGAGEKGVKSTDTEVIVLYLTARGASDTVHGALPCRGQVCVAGCLIPIEISKQRMLRPICVVRILFESGI